MRVLSWPVTIIFYFHLLGCLNSIGFCSENSLEGSSYQRTIAIGDIQANEKVLTEILIQANVMTPDKHLLPNIHVVFLGDLIGDGPNSPEVIKLIMKLKSESHNLNSKITIIAGNHEINLLLNRFNYISKEDRIHWAHWLDLNDDWKESIFNALRIRTHTPGPIEILRSFYLSLVPMAKVGKVFFVHSGISQRMIDSNLPEMTRNFKNKIKVVLNERASIGQTDWLFGPSGPTLTSETADPHLAEFILDSPISTNSMEAFLNQEQVAHVVTGHWVSHDGIKAHSIADSKIIHIDTGIGKDKGLASYLEITPSGLLIAHQWKSKNLKSLCQHQLN